MKITLLKRRNKKLTEFKKKEWELINPEHYGEELDWNYWDIKRIRLKAEENGKIVGALSGSTMAGVLHIEELIVEHDTRGLGIGKKLIKKVEEYSRKNGMHLMYLETGEGWKAVNFYEKLGFKKEALLKKFYSKINFWLMTKYL